MEKLVKRSRLFALVVMAGLLVTACSQPGGSTAPGGSGEPVGGKISILATWVDKEQENFLAMIQPWVDANNVEVEYEGNRDLATILTTRLEGNDPPDVAGIPNPG